MHAAHRRIQCTQLVEAERGRRACIPVGGGDAHPAALAHELILHVGAGGERRPSGEPRHAAD
jgi:hypothetical protein